MPSDLSALRGLLVGLAPAKQKISNARAWIIEHEAQMHDIAAVFVEVWHLPLLFDVLPPGCSMLCTSLAMLAVIFRVFLYILNNYIGACLLIFSCNRKFRPLPAGFPTDFRVHSRLLDVANHTQGAQYVFVRDFINCCNLQCVCPDPPLLGPDARSSAIFVLAEVFKDYRDAAAAVVASRAFNAEAVTQIWSASIVQLITAACVSQSSRALDQLQRVSKRLFLSRLCTLRSV